MGGCDQADKFISYTKFLVRPSLYMSDLGQLLIIISNKLSKMISRTNKLERNVYKLAKFFESSSNTVGSLPDKQF